MSDLVKFIDSPNSRQSAFNKYIHPHINDATPIDTSTGLANWELYEFTDPTHEFLNSLSPKLSKGIFNQRLRVYCLTGIQFAAPYERYQIYFEDSGNYISMYDYCNANDATPIFAEEALYFVVGNKYKPFSTSGILLVSNVGTMLEFTDTPGADTIHLNGNLYIKSQIPFVTVDESTVQKYSYHEGDINHTTGLIIDGTQFSTNAFLLDAGVNKILTNTALVVYTDSGKSKYILATFSFRAWDRQFAVMDFDQITDELKDVVGGTPVIERLSVFLNDANDDNAKTPSSVLFKDFIDFASKPKYMIEDLFTKGKASLVTISGKDSRINMNFADYDSYISKITSLSRRVTRELIPKEYGKLRNRIDLEDITEDGLKVKIVNRWMQVITIYINGRFYHGEFTRSDNLGLSTIIIPKSELDKYDSITTIEMVVEPLFTRRYDVVQNGIMKMAAPNYPIELHRNLIPIHGTYGTEVEIDLFVNGLWIDPKFYEIQMYDTYGFVYIKKNLDDMPVTDATFIVNRQKMYSRTISTTLQIQNYDLLDEYVKIYVKGILVPYEHFRDLYLDKYIDVDLITTSADPDDIEIHLLTLSNSALLDMIKDSTVNPLIQGFYMQDDTSFKIIFIPLRTIIDHIANFTPTNSIDSTGYPEHLQSNDVQLRSKFALDVLAIGKRIIVLDCNQVEGTGAINYIEENYPSLINSDGCLIVDSGEEVIPIGTLNDIYEAYPKK